MRSRARLHELGPRMGIPEGRALELSLLGDADVRNPRYDQAVRDRVRIGEGGRPYMTYRDAMELAMQFQPGDPTNPARDFLREVRLAIIEELKIPAGGEDRIKAYTAVGTPLDQLHGVDGFFVITKEGVQVPVTIDVTLREKGPRADLFVGTLPDSREDEERYLQIIEEIAVFIVSKFHERYRLARERGERGSSQRLEAAE